MLVHVLALTTLVTTCSDPIGQVCLFTCEKLGKKMLLDPKK